MQIICYNLHEENYTEQDELENESGYFVLIIKGNWLDEQPGTSKCGQLSSERHGIGLENGRRMVTCKNIIQTFTNEFEKFMSWMVYSLVVIGVVSSNLEACT